MKQYSQKEINKIFDELPQELRHAVLSPETANAIQKIAKNHKIKTRDISTLATLVGDILMGLLAPANLPETLNQELKIHKKRGDEILGDVTKLILHPVQNHLSSLYNKKLTPAKEKEVTPKLKNLPAQAEKPIKVPEKKDDSYREPIE